MEVRGYLTPAGPACAEIREKGSRFLALVEPVRSEGEAKEALSRIRSLHPSASHHCWARRIGEPPVERCSDDGEPNGTAGQPMLQVLRGAEVSDVLAVVVRWFGGTKLGKGGLARAYAGAVWEALVEMRSQRVVATEHLTLTLPYDRVGAVKRLVHPPAVALLAESYGEEVTIELEVHRHEAARLREALAELRVGVVVRSEEED